MCEKLVVPRSPRPCLLTEESPRLVTPRCPAASTGFATAPGTPETTAAFSQKVNRTTGCFQSGDEPVLHKSGGTLNFVWSRLKGLCWRGRAPVPVGHCRLPSWPPPHTTGAGVGDPESSELMYVSAHLSSLMLSFKRFRAQGTRSRGEAAIFHLQFLAFSSARSQNPSVPATCLMAPARGWT